MEGVEDRIEEAVAEISIKSGYWLRLLRKAVDEIKHLRASESVLIKRVNELKNELTQAEDTIEELRSAEPEDWFG